MLITPCLSPDFAGNKKGHSQKVSLTGGTEKTMSLQWQNKPLSHLLRHIGHVSLASIKGFKTQKDTLVFKDVSLFSFGLYSLR
jgi:hypothetical protein